MKCRISADSYDIHISMRIKERISMLLLFCSSLVSPKVIGKKSLVLKCHYFYFLTPATSFLTDLKMTLVKIVHLVRLYLMPIYRLSTGCFVIEILRGADIRPLPATVSVRSWPIFPSVRWFNPRSAGGGGV